MIEGRTVCFSFFEFPWDFSEINMSYFTIFGESFFHLAIYRILFLLPFSHFFWFANCWQ